MFPPYNIRVSGGFVLLAIWFVLANGWEPLATVLGAAAVHELGHWAVLRMLGAEVTGFRLGVLGAVLETNSRRLSYGGELAAVGANLVLCAFNLLPIRPLDGGRALYLLSAWAAGPVAGEAAVRWAGGVTAAALAALIAWVMLRTGGSLWLLPALLASVYWGAMPWHSGGCL